jgi:hypothetical protein
MLQIRKYYTLFLCVAFLLAGNSLHSQQAAAGMDVDSLSTHSGIDYRVGTITITGNKKTKDFIILREIPFLTGETYSLQDLVKKFDDARRQLLNTTLFITVVVAAQNFEGNQVNISVVVKERWYIFPSPYLKPVDRNLNQWLVEQKASLSRVNYGIKLLYYNATGRNDKLKASVGNGYTKQFGLDYDRLYIGKDLKWGMKVGFSSSRNREVNFNTVNDKQAFIKDDNNFLSSFTNMYALLTYRRKIKTRHSVGLAYAFGNVSDTVVKLNPAYLVAGNKSVRFAELFYNMEYFDLDYIPYPTRGYAAQLSFSKKGFDKNFNLSTFRIKGAGHWPITSKTFVSLVINSQLKLPFKQPYYNSRFLGYGDEFMQGYEYYVIDGVAGGFIKSTITRELVKFSIKPPTIRGKTFEPIPFRILAKVYGNTGYVHNPQPGDNGLSNKMLYSGGFGLDIVTFYDLTIKLEYSFNQLGQNDLFLHRRSIF